METKKDFTASDAFIASFQKPKLHGNWVLDLNPFTKLNVILALMLAGVLLGRYWPALAVNAVYFILCACTTKETFKAFFSLYIKATVILFLFVLVLNAVFRPGTTVYWEWGILVLTREGFLYGLFLALVLVEICGGIILFYLLTPQKDLMYSLEHCGVSRSVSYIMLAATQSIIDLGKSVNTIMESQSARGVETTGSLKVRFKALFPIMLPLLLGALAATEEKTVAMETRAFDAKVAPTHIYELRKAPVGEKIFCVAFDLMLVTAVVWRFVA